MCKILLDSADIEKAKEISKYYRLTGITTNPTILAKQSIDLKTKLEEIKKFTYDKYEIHIQTTENKAENKFMRNYEDFVINFAKVVKKRGLLESKGDDLGLVIKIKEEFEKMKIEKEKYLTIFE